MQQRRGKAKAWRVVGAFAPQTVIPAKGVARVSGLAQRGAEGTVGLGTNCGRMSQPTVTPALDSPIPRRLRHGPRLKAGVTISGVAPFSPLPPHVTPEEPRKRRHPGSRGPREPACICSIGRYRCRSALLWREMRPRRTAIACFFSPYARFTLIWRGSRSAGTGNRVVRSRGRRAVAVVAMQLGS